jgi:hypothetical protein
MKRWYYPQESQDDTESEIQAAWEFIANMDTRIDAADLLEWGDLLKDDDCSPKTSLHPDGDVPFTLMDQLHIDNELATIFLREKYDPTEAQIDAIVEQLPGTMTGDRRKTAKDYATSAVKDLDAHRDRLTDITVRPEHVIRPVCTEEPKRVEKYDVPELAAFILHSQDLPDTWATEIATNAQLKLAVAHLKPREDARLFAQVPKMRRLHTEGNEPGILEVLRDDYYKELEKAGLVNYKEHFRAVSQAVFTACGLVAGMDAGSTVNSGPLDKPGYHYQFIYPSTRRRIKKLATALLIQRGLLSNIGALYGERVKAGEKAAEHV